MSYVTFWYDPLGAVGYSPLGIKSTLLDAPNIVMYSIVKVGFSAEFQLRDFSFQMMQYWTVFADNICLLSISDTVFDGPLLNTGGAGHDWLS